LEEKPLVVEADCAAPIPLEEERKRLLGWQSSAVTIYGHHLQLEESPHPGSHLPPGAGFVQGLVPAGKEASAPLPPMGTTLKGHPSLSIPASASPSLAFFRSQR